jgi:hypothetical protein
MQIHWQEKWIGIPYHGQIIVLQGRHTSSPQHILLHIGPVDQLDETNSAFAQLPVELQSLLDSYADLFQPPTSLPPSRACDHEIPLIPGATPVFVRPYRYPPKLKDEIEKQVQDMLSQGLIWHSNSPFSSLVLLVRKRMVDTGSVLISATSTR